MATARTWWRVNHLRSRFLARGRAALGERFRSGGAGSELSGRQRHDPIETAGRGGLRRLLALDFQAGAAVLFIHWRVAAERRGGAGDLFLMIAGAAGREV